MSYPDRYANPERSVPCGRDLHGLKFDISIRPERHSVPSRSLHTPVFPDIRLAPPPTGLDPDVFAKCPFMSLMRVYCNA